MNSAAAEFIAYAQRFLEIETTSVSPFTERRHGPCFFGRVDRKPVVTQFDSSQADARTRYRRTERNLRRWICRFYFDPAIAGANNRPNSAEFGRLLAPAIAGSK